LSLAFTFSFPAYYASQTTKEKKKKKGERERARLKSIMAAKHAKKETFPYLVCMSSQGEGAEEAIKASTLPHSSQSQLHSAHFSSFLRKELFFSPFFL